MAEPYMNTMVQQYSDLLEPQYARSRAQIANMLGGRGTFYGTPGSNKLQLLEGQKLGDIGRFGMGLMQTQEQRAYDQPFQLANLLGNLPGTSGTYQPGTGWNWIGGPTQTLAGQAQNQINPYQQAQLNLSGRAQTLAEQAQSQISPYQQAQLNALGSQQEAERVRNYFNMLATLMGMTGGSNLTQTWGNLFPTNNQTVGGALGNLTL